MPLAFLHACLLGRYATYLRVRPANALQGAAWALAHVDKYASGVVGEVLLCEPVSHFLLRAVDRSSARRLPVLAGCPS